MKKYSKFLAISLTFLLTFTLVQPALAYSKGQSSVMQFGDNNLSINTLIDNKDIKQVIVTDENGKKVSEAEYFKDKNIVIVKDESGTTTIDLNQRDGIKIQEFDLPPDGGGGAYTHIVDNCYYFSDFSYNIYGFWEWQNDYNPNLYPSTKVTVANSGTCYAIKNDIWSMYNTRQNLIVVFGITVAAAVLALGVAAAVAFISTLQLSPQQQQQLFVQVNNQFNKQTRVDANLRILGYQF